MPYKLKNTTGSDIYIDRVGITIPAGEEFNTVNHRDYEIYDDPQITSLVSIGHIIVNEANPPLVVDSNEDAVSTLQWADKATLSIPDDLFGKFWVSWYAEIAANAKDFVYVRLFNKTDSAVLAGPVVFDKPIKKKNIEDAWSHYSGHISINLPNSARVFALQYKTASLTDSLKIRNVHMRYTKDRFI